jgi:hypothetical protein
MMERAGIAKTKGGEFSLSEWELLKSGLSGVSEKNLHKAKDAQQVSGIKKDMSEINDVSRLKTAAISGINHATLQERLYTAKQEYDYNRGLIIVFQDEISAYFKEHGRTTVMTHNGSMSAVPAVTNLEKYIKLNIALSKLISELESDLDLDVDGEDDPFG